MLELDGGMRPDEDFVIGVDFSTTPLASGETLVAEGSSVTATIYGSTSSADIIESDSMEIIDGDETDSVLQARITGVTKGKTYKVKFSGATSDDNLYTQNVIVKVSD